MLANAGFEVLRHGSGAEDNPREADSGVGERDTSRRR
jgi:hypothetical protein